MKYGRVIVPIVILGCIVILISSYLIWKSKIETVKGETPNLQTEQLTIIGEVDEQVEDTPALNRETIKTALINADENVQKLVLNRFDAGEKVQLLITGSTAMDDGTPGYAELLADALADTYGSFFETTVASFDGTSKDFIDEKVNEIDWTKTYDLVLYEPFTLRNNGKVEIEDEHKHIEAFEEIMHAEVSDSLLVLHPSYPIYKASFYLVQISALQEFALLNGTPYIDHWQNWPDTDSEDIKQFLDDKSAPNSEGAQVWADALISYFVAQ